MNWSRAGTRDKHIQKTTTKQRMIDVCGCQTNLCGNCSRRKQDEASCRPTPNSDDVWMASEILFVCNPATLVHFKLDEGLRTPPLGIGGCVT